MGNKCIFIVQNMKLGWFIDIIRMIMIKWIQAAGWEYYRVYTKK